MYLSTMQSWLQESALLIQAQPNTRITSKFTIEQHSKMLKRTRRKQPEQGKLVDSADTMRNVPRGSFTVKTFDAATGICLKYRTDKAQEVGRLMTGLAKLGRNMANLPPDSGAADDRDVDSERDVGTSPGQPEMKESGSVNVNVSKPATGHGKGKKRRGKR